LKKLHSIVCFLCLAGLIPIATLAQNAFATLENLNIEHGLSQTSVSYIFQDSRGIMWFGTEDGLNSYDGYQFTHFKHKAYDTTSLSASTVTRILEDPSQNLWVGTSNGINKLDLRTHKITRYPLAAAQYSGTGAAYIIDMIMDDQGKIVIATYDTVLHFDPITGNYQIKNEMSQRAPSALRKNNSLLLISSDRVWLGHERGISVYDLHKNSGVPLTGKLAQAIEGKRVFKLKMDQQNKVWVSTSEGLLRYDPETETIQHYPLDPAPELSKYGVIDLIQDRNGYFWLGTYHNVPYVLRPGDGTFRPLKVSNEIGAFHSIPSIFEDDSGIIWIGGFQGVHKFDPNRWKFQHFKESEIVDGLKDVLSIRSFTEKPDGTILIASSGEGLHRFDPRTKRLTDLNHLYGQLHPRYKENIKSILWDSHDYLWIGLWHEGLLRINQSTGETEFFGDDLLPSLSVRYLIEDRTGGVWVATFGGLLRFETETGQMNLYQASEDSLGLTDSGVQVLFSDSRGDLWAGTTKGGLNKFNFSRGTFEKYFYHPGDTSGISYNYITSFAETPSGTLWIGTYGGGLNKLHLPTGKITHYNTSSGLPNDVVYGLLTDPHGQLWISSNAGITLFNPLTEGFRNYDVQDGLQSNEFNSGSYFRSSSGQLFFGGVNGFNAFYADSITDNQHTPKLLFTDFLIHNRSMAPGPESPLMSTISHTDKIVLSHHQAVFSFQFAALNYTDPLKNQYAYQLEGFDEEWQYLGTRNFITFTNIDPGNYTLKIKGSNNDGIWNDSGLIMEIVILPPWWQSPWAYILYGALIVAGLVFWRKTVINRERLKSQYQLEHLKLEKAREMDRLKSTFFENISHEFRTPLTLIQGPLESIFRKGVPKELAAPYQVMINNSRRLHELIDQLMDLSKLEAGKMDLQAKYSDLVPMVSSVFKMFSTQNADPNINMELDIQCKSLWTFFDSDKMQKILYNLISNACKFTKEGTVKLELSESPGWARIMICDTGPGIPSHLQEKIFDRFYQTSSRDSIHQGTGIGLALTKELIDLHQGRITLESQEQKGSCFTIYLPLKQPAVTKPLAQKPPSSPNYELPQFPVAVEHWSNSHGDHQFKVLVVEDQKELRGFLKNILSEHYEVTVARHGLEGWEKALEAVPDIIISDIRMPGMDGFALCQKLKQDRRTSHIPVILLTAKSSKTNKLKGLEIGADDYLTKPFDEDELMALLRNRIAQRETLRQQFSHSLYLEPAKLALTPLDQQFLQQALQVMESNMDNPEFRVEAFYREMGMSRTQMHRKLKALTDQSTSEFMRSIRLKRAAQLLKENHGNVSEVSDAVGFNRVSTFIREFRKIYKVTPLQYRKEHFIQP